MLRYLFKNSKIGIIISYIATIICLLYSNNAPDGYEYLWLIPFSYALLLSFTNVRKYYFSYIGISILNLILFVRYVINPLFASLTGYYLDPRASLATTYANQLSIFLFIFEMICIFTALHYSIIKLRNLQNKQTSNTFVVDKNSFILLLFIIIGIISFFLFPSIKERTGFLIVEEIGILNLNSIASLGFIFTKNVLILAFLWVLAKEYTRFAKGDNPNKLLVVVFAFLAVGVVFSGGRLNIVVQSVSIIAILNYMNFATKNTLSIFAVIMVVVIISLTSYRYFGSGELSHFKINALEYFDLEVISSHLQSYFGGLHLISLTVDITDDFSIINNIDTFFNEILSSIVFVRQLFPPSSDQSTVLFNKIFGFFEGNSMILPTLGQGYMYFGILGAPILSILFSYLLYIAERKIIITRNIGEKLAFYMLAARLAFFPMQNLNIITDTIFNIFVPLYIFIVINKKLSSYPIR